MDESEGLWRRLLSSGQKVALCWCQIPIWYKEDIQACVCVPAVMTHQPRYGAPPRRNMFLPLRVFVSCRRLAATRSDRVRISLLSSCQSLPEEGGAAPTRQDVTLKRQSEILRRRRALGTPSEWWLWRPSGWRPARLQRTDDVRRSSSSRKLIREEQESLSSNLRCFTC